jgi:anhydro-N-acetylmuramic acid kinase
MAASEQCTPSTLQIGEASIIAQVTGIPTVSDFRTADMAAGGNGAPLITFADYHLLRDKIKGRVVQNIGGIANCTLLPANCGIADVTAFDTGPGNMVIDGLVARITDSREACDRNGHIAASGVVNQRLLNDLLAHSYFSAPPPKTTGRELFGMSYVNRLITKARERAISDNDLVAIATALTSESILRAYHDFVFPRMHVDEVILGGGGAQNPFLVGLLRHGLPDDIHLLAHEDVGISSKAKEAIGFALLGWARLHNIPGNVPSATGASHQVLLGKIYQAR